ncbi:unnamed protein product, partial [Brenthis ino]
MIAVIGIIAAIFAVWLYVGLLETVLVGVTLSFLYVVIFKSRWCYVAITTAPRDLRALWCYIKILWTAKKFSSKNYTLPDIFHETVQKHPNKTCFLFQNQVWTFAMVETFSLRVTAVLKNQGIKKGNIVGMLMNNCPEMPAIWLGNARLGAISPLINTNLRGNALIHSISVAKCDVLIFSDEYQSAIQEISSQLDPKLKLFKFTHRPLNASTSEKLASGDGICDFTALLETTPPAPWTLADANGFNGELLYIYTSGTTGLPKAAVISNSRFVFMACGLHNLSLNSSDIVYSPLPLYHTAGGVVSVGQALLFGCTVVLKPKFSASQYFPDCVKYNATAAHYIGEMCRYVLATPPSPSDKEHSVRVIYGNGLRPQIWVEFVKRFNIQHVTEFYGATEGNANIANTDGTPGAIGFISRIIPSVYPIAIIKVDQETGEPVRDSRGLCQVAAAGEPGVFVGKISPNNPTREYLGYVDKSASDKKVVRDVFKHGDSAFISGDILVADELGYLYFRDRTGDTFRWRGENVSTSEVEAAISAVTKQRDAVVYGVLVPDTEGRAGMCGIVDTNGTLDLDKLAKDLSRHLPPYARPIFIRVMTSMDMTGTFKMKKTDLQKEGFDPSLVKADKLYYLDLKQMKYLPLGPEEYQKILKGQIRL